MREQSLRGGRCVSLLPSGIRRWAKNESWFGVLSYVLYCYLYVRRCLARVTARHLRDSYPVTSRWYRLPAGFIQSTAASTACRDRRFDFANRLGQD